MTNSYSLYDFLNGCEGNWRNAVFVSCSPCRHTCKNRGCGHLLCADREGRPHLISVQIFECLTGQKIDPTECIGTLSKSAFASVYRAYLLWELTDDTQCPLRHLNVQIDTLI